MHYGNDARVTQQLQATGTKARLPERLCKLFDEVGQADQLCDELEKRLITALEPLPPDSLAIRSAAGLDANGSDLGCRIAEMTDRLASTNSRLRALLQRIDL